MQIDSVSLPLINFRKFIIGEGFCITLEENNPKKKRKWVDLVNHRHRPRNPIFTQKSFFVFKDKGAELICIFNTSSQTEKVFTFVNSINANFLLW